MKNQFQNLTEEQRHKLLNLMNFFEELFDETIDTWKHIQ